MSTLREALQRGLAMASRGEVRDAVSVLDEALLEAVGTGDPVWISLIGRNLALLCERDKQLPRAVNYIKDILNKVPTDRRSLYELGVLLEQLGDLDGSVLAFTQSLDLSLLANDQDLLNLLATKGFGNRAGTTD